MPAEVTSHQMTRQILGLLPGAVKWPNIDFSLLAPLLPWRHWSPLFLMCVVLPWHAAGFWNPCCIVFSVEDRPLSPPEEARPPSKVSCLLGPQIIKMHKTGSLVIYL